MSNSDNKPGDENPFENFNFFEENGDASPADESESGADMPELDFSAFPSEAETNSEDTGGLFGDLDFGADSTASDFPDLPVEIPSSSEMPMIAAVEQPEEQAATEIAPVVAAVADEKEDKKAKAKKAKKEKTPKARKEKKPREKKEGAGFSWAGTTYLVLAILALIAAVAGVVYFIINAPAGATVMYYLVPIPAFAIIGLCIAAVPFLFWRVQDKLRYGEVMLGLAVVALAIGLIAAFIELYQYDFIFKL